MADTPRDNLSPLPVRLAVYAVLVLIALAAIRVIDSHVMHTAQKTHQRAAP